MMTDRHFGIAGPWAWTLDPEISLGYYLDERLVCALKVLQGL